MGQLDILSSMPTRVDFVLGRIDRIHLRELILHWCARCGLEGLVAERFEVAALAVADAIVFDRALGQGGLSFTFAPYTHCLEVEIEFHKPGAKSFGPQALANFLPLELEGVDKVLWIEKGSRVCLRLTQFLRDSGHPNELYFLNLAPRIAAKVHIAQGPDGAGLVSKDAAHTVLRLPPLGLVAVRAMDGKTPLRDVYRDLVKEFGLFHPRQLGRLVEQLHQTGMIVSGERLLHKNERPAWFNRLGQLLSFDWPVNNGSERMDRLNKRFGWLFGRTMLLFWSLFVILSLVVFNFDLDEHTHVFESPIQVIDGLRPLPLAAFYVTLGVITALHELAHGLTCVRNGGEVNCFGLMIYYGSVAAYCDTTDAWRFPNKWRRIAVSFAGPMTNIVLGCVLAWGDLFSSRLGFPELGDFLGALAMISMIMAIFNLTPVLELDGYYILSDFTELPRLSHQAREFMSRVIRWRRPFSDKPLKLIQYAALGSYGVISPLFGIALLALLAWKLAFEPTYKANQYWFIFSLFMLLASVMQKLYGACRCWHVNNRLKEIVIK